MAQLRIWHKVNDYQAWRAMFDSDPLDRRASGVRRFRIVRGADDPDEVGVDLEFDSLEQASALRDRLLAMWQGPAGALFTDVQAVVVDVVEQGEL